MKTLTHKETFAAAREFLAELRHAWDQCPDNLRESAEPLRESAKLPGVVDVHTPAVAHHWQQVEPPERLKKLMEVILAAATRQGGIDSKGIRAALRDVMLDFDDDEASAAVKTLRDSGRAEIVGGKLHVKKAAAAVAPEDDLLATESLRESAAAPAQAHTPFTGVDAHGHKWVQGKQVKVGDHAGAAKAHGAAAEAHAHAGKAAPAAAQKPASHGTPAMTPEDVAIDKATQARAKAEYPRLRDEYLKKGGGAFDAAGKLTSVTLNTDEWRELFPEYTGTNAGAVHEASSYLNKQLYSEALKEMKGKGNGKMVVLAGGGGSGKGSAVGAFFDEAQYPIRLDQASDHYGKLSAKLDEAKAAGFEPEYIFVDRHPESAWEGVVGRAVNARKKGNAARTVPLEVALRANIESRKAALEILKHRPDVPPRVIDNNHGVGQARLITDRAEAIAFLESQDHEYEPLLEKMRNATLARHESGEIPADIATGLVGAGPVAARRPQPRPTAAGP